MVCVSTPKNINMLPRDILRQIFSILSINDICRSVAPVCTEWRNVSDDKSLWRIIHLSDTVREMKIVELLKRSPYLTELNVSERSVDVILRIVAEHCPKIQRVLLNNCHDFHISCPVLISKCPEICHVVFRKSACSTRSCWNCLKMYIHLTELPKLKYVKINDVEIRNDVNGIYQNIVTYCTKMLKVDAFPSVSINQLHQHFYDSSNEHKTTAINALAEIIAEYHTND